MVQGAELVWKIADLVVEYEQLAERRTHAQLRRQLSEVIVGQIKVPKLTQLTDGRRQVRQVVGTEVELLNEGIAIKDSQGNGAESLATEIQTGPILAILVLVDVDGTTPVLLLSIGLVIAVAVIVAGRGDAGGQDGPNPAVLGGFGAGKKMRLVLLGHGLVGAPAFLIGLCLVGQKLTSKLALLVSGDAVLVAARGEGGSGRQDTRGEGRVRGMVLLMVMLLLLLLLGMVLMLVLMLALRLDVVVHHLRSHGAAARHAIETRAVSLLRAVHDPSCSTRWRGGGSLR